MPSRKLPRPKEHEELQLPHLVEKPWGWEKWLELWHDESTGRGYCLKLIFLKAGEKSSLQYHKQKVETQYILNGRAEVYLEREKGLVEKTSFSQGDFFTVSPGKRHRVYALTDLTLLEVSTPELEDVVRVQDEYGRKK